MLLQNTLDLSTFEIVRFRIWNQTSHPNDKGVGTKYFNTNSGHEGYNRENIYTATGWRMSAYMDDIDRINEKLDLIFGEEIDTDTIIDSWKEVQDFLAGIEDTENLMDLLNSKLDKTGGTIRGNLIMAGGHVVTRELYASADNTYNLGNISRRWANIHTMLINGGTPIHSGNVGEHTAGAANKLADDTAYTVWGRTFFENGKPKNVSNAPILNNNSGLYFKNAAGDANKLLFYFDTEEQLHIGRDSATDKNSTHIYGNPIYFKSSNTGQPLVTITEGGQVLVGNSSVPNEENCLFHLNKRGHFGTAISSYTLGGFPRYGLTVGNVNEYGLYLYTTGDSQSHIQSTRFDGTATAYALNLNPLGGNVNIASAGAYTNVKGSLNVAGVLSISDEITLSKSSITTKVSYLAKRGSGNYIWGYSADDYLCLGAGGTTLTKAASSMVIESTKLYAGTTNAVSLGTSSYRWSNVYSVNGDFSGRVLIGGAEDDGTTPLQVKGGVLVSSSTTWMNETTKITQSGLSLIGRDSGGYYQGTYFYNHSGVQIAFAGINATGGGDAISSYYVGPDATKINAWFSVNSEKSAFNVLTSFSNRVLIGGVADDTISALNVKGTTRVEDIVTRKGGAEWASGYYSIDSSQNKLGGFGFHVKDNALVKAYIGTSFSAPWFTINTEESNFNVLTNFNGGALIPTGQKMTFGADGPTMEYDADANAIKVTGNIYATGTMASGGKAAEGENTTGNAMVYQYDLASGESVYTVDNVKGSTNVIVQIFEWNGNTSSWDMILTDVSVKADAITVTFGRTTTVNHMVTVC